MRQIYLPDQDVIHILYFFNSSKTKSTVGLIPFILAYVRISPSLDVILIRQASISSQFGQARLIHLFLESQCSGLILYPVEMSVRLVRLQLYRTQRTVVPSRVTYFGLIYGVYFAIVNLYCFRIAKLQKLFDMSNISSLKARTSKKTLYYLNKSG